MRFILVDEILELEPGKRVLARKCLGPDQDFFADHFPGFPVVPGVLLTEMMAQASGKCLDTEDPSRGKAMLVRIEQASFREWMRPGETAMIHCEVRKSRPSFATTSCRIAVGERAICSAELMFSFLPQDRLAPDYRDEVLDRFFARTRPSSGT